MDSAKRKELRSAYKDKAAVGGIYRVQCSGNGHAWVKSTTNLAGQKNKFAFSISTGSCPEPTMQTEWIEYGPQSFSFTILEELEQKGAQTEGEFSEDIKTLFEIWLEKHGQEEIAHGTDH
jgi:hypothetical protein